MMEQFTKPLKTKYLPTFNLILFKDRQQWFSLVVLMIGIAFTQVADGEKLDDDVDDINYVHKVKGFFAVFVACVSSGCSKTKREIVNNWNCRICWCFL